MNKRYFILASFCSLLAVNTALAQSQVGHAEGYGIVMTNTDTVQVAHNDFTTLSVASDQDFKVQSNNEWITVQKISKKSVAIFCKNNATEQERKGSITLISADGKTQKEVTVMQSGINGSHFIPGNTGYEAPAMGWSAQRTFSDNANEENIQQQAEALKRLGLSQAGYRLVNLGNGVFGGRDAEGQLKHHPANFPNGLKPVVDKIHQLGLEAGVTSDAGNNVGNGSYGAGAGLLGHEQLDCDYFFKKLGFDFMQVDFAEGLKEGNNGKVQERFSTIHKAIQNTGKKNAGMSANLWAYPGTWVHDMANSWRTAADIKADWNSIKNTIHENLYLSAYSYEGRFNDMDAILANSALNEEEEKTQFGMWCMMNSPLLIGSDLNQLDAKTLVMLKNKTLISLNQNALSEQAYVVQQTNGCYILVKDVNKDKLDARRAVAIYNPTDQPRKLILSVDKFDLGGKIKVYDAFAQKEVDCVNNNMQLVIPAHGTNIFMLDAEIRSERSLYEAETGYIAAYQELTDARQAKTGYYEEDEKFSGGAKVCGLGGSNENGLEWKNVYSYEGGTYQIKFTYQANEDAAFNVEVNGQDIKKIEVKKNLYTTTACTTVAIDLKKGYNSIRLYNKEGIMPDMDCMTLSAGKATSLFVEAENFNIKGGWKVDQQFMDLMGSPYIIAHGMGVPVENAATEIEVPSSNTYHVWARTFNWVSPWTTKKDGPGKFQLSVDGKKLETVLGCKGNQWEWQYAGTVTMSEGKHALTIHDLTGFDGRVDAIYFNTEKVAPPADMKELGKFRRTQLNIPNTPEVQKDFDLVVCGGGIAGMCTAMTAARLGMKVALIQDRPVVGGNNSAEVRVHLGGRIEAAPYKNIGNLIKEFGHTKGGNAKPAENYEDNRKMEWIQSEKNISLFLSNRVNQVQMKGDQIEYVIAQNVQNGVRTLFRSPLFVDCTGDGTIGVLAGADFRMGRESKAEFNEPSAPTFADDMTMGASVQWYSKSTSTASEFPIFEYGVEFNEQNKEAVTMGEWTWENGMRQDQITDFERIRDYGMMVIYSNWSFLKNKYSKKSNYANRQLDWVAYVAGKRESRRLMGDYILTGNDILDNKPMPDGTATTSWSVDLHYPVAANEANFNGEAFKSYASQREIYGYPIPYRCFYSRNVSNLFMAGRNISVTHMALGTTRVMRTCGMIGEVVGMAASICHKHNTLPRSVYEKYFEELKTLMEQGAGKQGLPNNQLFNTGHWKGPWRPYTY